MLECDLHQTGKESPKALLMKPFGAWVAWGILAGFGDGIAFAQTPERTIGAYQKLADSSIGDQVRGKVVFENRQKAGCIVCHSVDGSRTGVGPDLASIGFKYDRKRLVESVLEPSKMIADGYGTTLVATDSGQIFSGVLQRVTDRFVELKTTESRIVRVPHGDIAEQRQGTISLMPEGIHTTIPPEEFVDLIAYLESLRASVGLPVHSAGFLDDVPLARKPVAFKPFFPSEIWFDHPVAMVPLPNNPDQFVVAEQGGKCWRISKPSGSKELLLDISSQVRVGGATGLLGFVLHPRFPKDPRVFLKYQINDKGRITTIVEERQWSTNSQTVCELVSPREIFRIIGSTQDHNGGSIAFGPDSMLYVGMGDSGPQRDPEGHGQDLKTLLGKILRVDINGKDKDLPYRIPEDNPFLEHSTARKEIWALGFREPWRISFDSKTKDLWVGDVGQDRFEEIAIVRKGENHGWNVYEGFAEFSNQFRSKDTKFVPPIVSYPRSLGVSVTGGHVYRGKRSPQFEGWYLFGDFESRRTWGLRENNRKLVQCVELGQAPGRIVSFAENSDGELLILGFDDGIIRWLDLTKADPTPTKRTVIAATGERNPVLWRYTQKSPDSDWMKSDFNDKDWQVGPAGFGSIGTPGGIIRTDWRSSDIWLRREFTANLSNNPNGKPSKPILRLHHDEDVEIYINGVLAARANRWTSGYVDLPISDAAIQAIRNGTNCLAVHCHQKTGGQYIDVGILDSR